MSKIQQKTQGKNWAFTIWSCTDQDIQWATNLICGYIIVTKEFGENKDKPHLQGFVQFQSNHRLASLKKSHPTAHWEHCNGGADAAANYVQKVDSELITCRGVLRTRAVMAQERKDLWESSRASAAKGDFDGIDDELAVRYYGNFKRIRFDNICTKEALDEIDNVWLWGPTGMGKSRWAHNIPNAYVKVKGRWWCNYDGEEIVVIDELSPRDKNEVDQLKVWADHYPFPCEVKGGMMKSIRPKRIIVTSNFHPENIWDDVRDLKPIERRFKIVEITEPLDKDKEF